MYLLLELNDEEVLVPSDWAGAGSAGLGPRGAEGEVREADERRYIAELSAQSSGIAQVRRNEAERDGMSWIDVDIEGVEQDEIWVGGNDSLEASHRRHEGGKRQTERNRDEADTADDMEGRHLAV
jgi:hypothetical protein